MVLACWHSLHVAFCPLRLASEDSYLLPSASSAHETSWGQAPHTMQPYRYATSHCVLHAFAYYTSCLPAHCAHQRYATKLKTALSAVFLQPKSSCKNVSIACVVQSVQDPVAATAQQQLHAAVPMGGVEFGARVSGQLAGLAAEQQQAPAAQLVSKFGQFDQHTHGIAAAQPAGPTVQHPTQFEGAPPPLQASLALLQPTDAFPGAPLEANDARFPLFSAAQQQGTSMGGQDAPSNGQAAGRFRSADPDGANSAGTVLPFARL